MNWSENIAESLPEPRDDDSVSLRQDIADELADHLQSALARRLVTAADIDRAQAQVLDKFGDPHQIARQLWWDALREKIMSQRVMLALTALLAVVTLTALALIWRVVERSQAATLAMIEQAQKANEALLARMAALPTENAAGAKSVPAEPARSVDWNPVKVHFTLGAKDGPPATGFTVSLMRVKSSIVGGMGGMPGNELIAEERSGPDGLVDLGLVSPGKYQLAMTAPWGEIARKSLIVAPASEQVIEIACPPAPLETSSVAVSAELPQDVREKKVRVAFQLVQDTRTFEGTEWGTTFNGQMLQGQHLDLLFFPGGEVAVREASGRFTQSFTGGTQKRSPAASSAKLAVGDYYLEDIVIAVRHPKHGIATPGQPPEGYVRIADHRIATGGSFGWGGPGSPRFYSHAELAQCPKFVVEPNKLNEWRIAIPEELLQGAREKLDQPEPEGPQEAEPET